MHWLKPLIANSISRLSPRLWLELRILRHDKHFEPEFWFVPKLTRPHSVVVDVGANVGHYTVYMARFAKTVHAFEPNPICVEQLNRVAPGNVVLHRIGLSDKEGKSKLRFDPENTGIGTLSRSNDISKNPDVNQIQELEVPITRLDSLGLSDVSFIKIDVEGYEEAVVRGCEGLLADPFPSFLIEVEERHNQGGLGRLQNWFGARGYKGLFLNGSKLVQLAHFDGAIHQEWGVSTPYINNFFFIHQSHLDEFLSRLPSTKP